MAELLLVMKSFFVIMKHRGFTRQVFIKILLTKNHLLNRFTRNYTNFDNNRLFNTAGKFYISAMEMRRYSRSNWLKRNIFSWEAWYKYISLYGQSAKRAFWVIIFVLLLCSFIICFDPNIHQLSIAPTSDGFFQDVTQFVNIFFRAVKYNLYALIQPAEWTIKDKISLTAFVTAWERVLVIILGTFFLLSLKRRFRRN